MKKMFSFLILIMCVFVCFACGKDPVISFAHENITVNIGDTYTIKDEDIKVTDAKKKYKIIIEDNTVATIDNNIITPLKKGETTIKIQLEDDEDIFCEVPLIVTHIIYATSAVVDNDYVQINIHQNATAINKITLNEGCNEVPTITYNNSVIDYNYITGTITALREGNTTVVVLFDNCNISFNVNVVNVVYTKQFEVHDCSVYEETLGKFSFLVFPSSSNTYEFYTNSDIIEVYSDGTYNAIEVGEAEVTVKYLISERDDYTYVTFKVTILERVSDFNATISHIDNSLVRYFLKDKLYRLTISNIENISTEKVALSNNILVENITTDNEKIYVDFYFKNTGSVTIDIQIILDQYNILNKSINTIVNSYDDFEIFAKWSIYSQTVLSDGKYHIYLNEPEMANYLKFSIVFEGEVVSEDYLIYDITSGTRVLCLDTESEGSKQFTFLPTEIGEYVFEFVIEDDVIKTAIVVVQNNL